MTPFKYLWYANLLIIDKYNSVTVHDMLHIYCYFYEQYP